MIIPELIVSGAELDEKYDRKKGWKGWRRRSTWL